MDRPRRSSTWAWRRARELRFALTPAESLLWEHLRRHCGDGRPKWRRQHTIYGLIPDFYCHAARMIVEVDGWWHDGRESLDAQRDAFFLDRGIETVRVSNDEVRRDAQSVAVVLDEWAMQRIRGLA